MSTKGLESHHLKCYCAKFAQMGFFCQVHCQYMTAYLSVSANHSVVWTSRVCLSVKLNPKDGRGVIGKGRRMFHTMQRWKED